MNIAKSQRAGRRIPSTVEPLEQRIAPATFLVTSTADSGAGSLRQAILDANSTSNGGGPDVINFSISAAPFVIAPTTPLPDITEAVIIDGYSQSGTTQNNLSVGTNATLLVELSGVNLSLGNGLVLGGAGGSTVRGLAIGGFGTGAGESGIGILIKSNNNHIEGNFIGTNAAGNASPSTENRLAGIAVGDLFSSTPNYSGNLIGGTGPVDRNMITGNVTGITLDSQSMGTQILGNLIGLDKSGTTAYGNGTFGVFDRGQNTVIGDGSPNGRNIISGNGTGGINTGQNSNVQIRGNYIGTSADGINALANNGPGIRVQFGGSNGVIENNIIAGNLSDGIQLGSPVGDGGAFNFSVRSNFIGVNSAANPLANGGAGISLNTNASNNTIGGTVGGQGNTIANNTLSGIQDFGGGTNNRFYANNIRSNGGLGINVGGTNENFFGVTANDSLDTDGATNWPVIQTYTNTGNAVTLDGALNAQPNRTYRVEFFAVAPNQIDASGHGEGSVFLGFRDITTNTSGAAAFNFTQTTSLPTNTAFTATATPVANGSTSEFGPAKGPSVSYTWTGPANGDWFVPGNWSPAGVPGPLDNATVGVGSLSLSAPVSVATFNFSGGSIAGTGTVTALQAFNWTGGTHASGGVRINSGATGLFNGTGFLEWTNGALENYGTLNVQGSGAFFNEGSFINSGTSAVVNLSAGFIDADGSATAVALLNSGTINKLGGTSFGFGSISMANSGKLRALAGVFAMESISQSSGLIELAGGDFSVTAAISLNGGDLAGGGTITGNVVNSGGRIFIGGKDLPGTLSVSGNYSQGSTGVLYADLAGTTPGTQHDRLNVSGTATLAGTLQKQLLGTYVTRVGDSFTVVNAGTRNGVFSSSLGQPPIPVSYSATDATLSVNGFTVTNTNDTGAGSLRQAIIDANAQPGLDFISFNIPGGGLKTITPLSLLPALSDDVVLDGYTQPGSQVNTLPVGSNATLMIELNGASVPNGTGSENGIDVLSGKALISGFVINRWNGYGISVGTNGGGSRIAGNWIGPDATGNAAPTNPQFGILLDNVGSVQIGSSLSRDRNVISGNDGNGIEINGASAFGNVIQGNYIGTNAGGNAMLGNRFDGIYTQGGNTMIGGAAAGEGNVISASQASVGILINLSSASGSTVRGNLIGTDATGTLDFGNFDFGVEVVGASSVTIGGPSQGEGNIIAGNGNAGISVEGNSPGAQIFGNYIGTDKTGTLSLGNALGVLLYQVSGATVGGVQPASQNVIAFNSGSGVSVEIGSGTASGNTIRGNSFYGNAGLAINLVSAGDPTNGVTPNDSFDGDAGANDLINFPTLSTFSSGAGFTVQGTYSGLANQSFTIDFYSSTAADPSGYGEGRYFMGSMTVTTDSGGTAPIFATLQGFLPPGGFITATATGTNSQSTSEFSSALATSVTRTWDAGGGADTDWFNPLNWSGDVVPGTGDTAELLSNFTVTLSGPVTIAKFTQADGTVTGGGSMTITSEFLWSKGTQTGPSTLTIANGAVATLSGASSKTLDRRFLDNQGTVIIDGTGPLQFTNGPLVTNSGLFEFQTDADYLALDTTGATFNNSGTLRKAGGTSESGVGLGSANLTVNNTGVIEVLTGTLSFFGNFAQTGGATLLAGGNIGGGTLLTFSGGELVGAGTITGGVNNTGAVIRPGGAGTLGTLAITGAFSQGAGGTYEWDASGLGAGQFDQITVGGVATLAGTLDVDFLGVYLPVFGNNFKAVSSTSAPGQFAMLTGDTLGLFQTSDSTGLTISRGGLNYIWDGGGGADRSWFNPLNWNYDLNVPGIGDSASLLTNDAIALDANVTVANFTISNGSIGATTGTGDLTITNSLVWDGGIFAVGGKLNLLPTTTTTLGGTAWTSQREIQNAGTMNFMAGGTFALQFGVTFFNSGTVNLDAAGITFEFRNGGGGNLTNNVGGILNIGETNSQVIGGMFNNAGVINLAAAKTFTTFSPGASSGVWNLDAGSQFKFDHSFLTTTLTDAAFNGNGTVRVQSISTLAFPAGTTTNFASGVTFSQDNGALSGPGSVIIGGAATLTGVTFSGGVNAGFTGTVTVPGTTLSITSGAAVSFTGTTTFTGNGGVVLADSSALNNAGTLSIETTNFTGGVAGGVVNNTGTFTRVPFGGEAVIDAAFNNAGLFEVQAATRMSGTFIQLDGETFVNNASLASAQVMSFQGGVLRGVGSMGGVSNSGAIIRPGDQGTVGTLHVGSFEQLSGGTLEIDIVGSGAGQFDILDVTGASTLGGGLSVDTISPFVPSVGDTFLVLPTSVSATGDFASFTGDIARLTKSVGSQGVLLAGSAATFVWDNDAGDGDWFNPVNWNFDSGTPGSADIAVLDINSLITLASTATVSEFRQSTGTISGGGSLIVNQAFSWSGGQNGISLTTGSGSANTIGGGGMTFSGLVMSLGGTTIFGGSGDITLAGSSASIRNKGSFEFTSDAGISGTGFFFNDATGNGMTKTGISDVEIAVSFGNAAPLSILGGSLKLSGGASWQSSLTTVVSSGATLDFDGNAKTYLFGEGNTFSGSGRTRLIDGTFNFTGSAPNTVSIGHTLVQSGGTVTGDADIVVNGQFEWSGGLQEGPGETIISTNASATLIGSGSKQLDLRTLTTNLDSSLTISGDGALEFANGARIDSAGVLSLQSAAPLNDIGGAPSSVNVLSGGSLEKTTAAVVMIDVPFTNAGTVTLSDGGTTFLASFTQTSGLTILAGGGIGFANAAEFQGGSLIGSGGISGSIINTGAAIVPGDSGSIGTFAISGDYSQGAAGTLEIEIDSTIPTTFDTIVVGGVASLDGSVTVSLIHGAQLSPGQSVDVLSAQTVSGVFSSESVPSGFQTGYTGTTFFVKAPALPPGLVNLEELTGRNGFLATGGAAGAQVGFSVSGLGDVNGDGFADFVLGAPGVAAAYVVFGKATSFGTEFDLSALDGTSGFVLSSATIADAAGFSVGGAGDVNKDGFADIIVGAPGYGTLGNEGAVYVIFGKSGGFAPSLSLGDINGSNGFQITGVAQDDGSGFSVKNAGDVNRDGFDDLIIGAPNANINGITTGGAYVVFGSQLAFPATITLGSLNGTNGFRIAGQTAGDRFGESVSGAGDINGDGAADLVIGAPEFSGAAGVGTGAAYVVFGHSGAFPASLAVDSLNGKTGFRMEGLNANEHIGTSVSTAGDMNGDGVADVVVGGKVLRIEADGSDSGDAYVVFGKKKAFAATLDLSTLNGANGFRVYTETKPNAGGISVSSAGDYNNDGFDDILIGSPLSHLNSGAVYLMFGRQSGFAPELSLTTLNATTGFRFVTGMPLASLGGSVSGAGDINGDGFADIVIGSPGIGSTQNSAGSGGSFVLYGKGTLDIPQVAPIGSTAIFNDVDGDLITISVTGGKITADMLTFGSAGELLMVDFNATNTLKDGANITFTVKKNGGNGLLNVGAIDATGRRLGVIKVTGDLGQIDIGNGDPKRPAIKQLIVGSIGQYGSDTQLPGTVDPLVSEINGSLPKLVVKGLFKNATLNVSGALGNVTINGEFSGTGAFDSTQLAGLAALGHGQIGHVSGGTTLASSGLSAGSIGSLNFKQSMSNTAVSARGSIGTTTVGGSINKSAIVAAGALRVVKVFGAITSDDPDVPSVIAALASPPSSKPAAAIAINALTVRGDVRNAEILLGYDSSFTPVNGDASAGNVTITGSFIASSIAAGVRDEGDDGFGLNDVRIGSPDPDPTPTIISRIASLVIKGVAEGSDTAGDSFGIVAQEIKKAKINGQKILLNKTIKDDILVGTKGDFHLIEIV